MQLSRRLYTIAQCVPRGSRVIDVGTDHAYIPIYLLKNHIAVFCIATDINKGPLQKAKLNMKLHHIDAIDLRLTNGLRGIRHGEADVIIMAGMGGCLMIDILEQDLKLIKSFDRLILQPQQDIPRLRKFLHGIGFRIEDEAFVEEDGKYYTVIIAVPGQEKYKNDYEYIYGKVLIEKRTEPFKAYMIKKQEKLSILFDTINGRNSKHIDQRKKELEAELKMHEEVIKCIF
ncbi:tRNA (adenine(22)-N(1))-methyltransferase [Cellulosilyticum sp. I15G10I2]|uniref:tRNA (adenine(22)-N(1))-methyltransferase n=1 Tax=Cellulosilyticum sp. I15G10I2 TaxID=1892843 RepID=UPI00085C1184|nr:class I SAM-dependent methyltransferase [Cellulosilyticum sp. I15G10I2]